MTGIREARVAGLYDGDLEAVNKVKRATRMIPVTDGHALRDVLQEWSIRHVQNTMPGYFTNARVVVLGGMNHARTIRILQEYTQNFEFADPLLRLDVLKRMDANPVLELAANIGMWPVRQLPGPVRSKVKAPGHGVSRTLARRALDDAHVVVATCDELSAFNVGDLRGKSVVASSVSDERLAEMAALDVDMVLDSTPQPFDFTITAAVLEAMMLAASSSPAGPADQRRPARHDRVRRPRAPGALPQRLPPAQPLRVRDPSAVPAVPDQRRAAAHHRARVARRSSWTVSRRRWPTPRR